MKHKEIAIIGAGIGGLTTALALKKKGFKVSVYESAKEIKPLGAGIVMANNAMQIFDKLGIRTKIENAGKKISSICITNSQLKSISTSNLTSFEKKYGVFNVAIHRADLQNILANELGWENIFLGKRLNKIEQKDNYTLYFNDTSKVETPILIGADGIRSKVRTELFGDLKLRDTQQRCWRGVCELDTLEKFNHEAYELWGQGTRFGFVKINGKQVYWYAVVMEYMLKNNNEVKDFFIDYHPIVKDLIQNTETNNIIFNDIIDLAPIQTWYQDNACIMGDAAHATTPNMGQGACQAVEDAYVISELLAKGLEPSEAFKKYQKIRMKKAHFIVNTSWKIGVVSHIQNPLLCAIRNAFMNILPKNFNDKQLEKVFTIADLKL